MRKLPWFIRYPLATFLFPAWILCFLVLILISFIFQLVPGLLLSAIGEIADGDGSRFLPDKLICEKWVDFTQWVSK